MQQRMYKTKTCDVDNLQKCLMQTGCDFFCPSFTFTAILVVLYGRQPEIKKNEMNEIDQWRDHLRSCVRDGGGYFEHML